MLDLSNSEWTAVTSAPNPGRLLQASINSISDSSVLVIGGYTYGPVPSASGVWILSSSLTWTRFPVALPNFLYSHTTVVIEGVAYVFGGATFSGILNTLFTLKIVNDSAVGELANISVSGNWPQARFYHTAVAVSFQGAQSMAVYGGLNVNGNSIGDLWVFNTITQRWTELYNVQNCQEVLIGQPSCLSGHAAVALSPRKMAIIGGQLFDDSSTATTFVFDFKTLEWTELPTSGLGLVNSMSVGLMRGGSVLLFGGGQPLLQLTPGCPSPNYSTSFASETCRPCAAGSYLVSGNCVSCPEGFSTLNPGMTSKDSCIDVCDIDQCVHGSCSVVNGEPSCSCKIGYSGRRCEVGFSCMKSMP